MSVNSTQSLQLCVVIWRFRLSGYYKKICRHLSETLPQKLISFFSEERRLIIYSKKASGLSAHIQSPGMLPVFEVHWQEDSQSWQPEDHWQRINKLAENLPKMLQLPHDRVFRQEIKLPIIAVKYLRETIRNNLSIWTPFSEDEIFFDAAIREISGDYAYVDISIVDRKLINDFKLFKISGIDLISTNSTNDILIHISNKRIKNKFKTINLFLFTSFTIISASVFLLFNNQINNQIYEINKQKLALVKELREQARLEEEIGRTMNQIAFLDDRAKYRRAVSPIIMRIGSALPSEGSLTAFEFSHGRGKFTVRLSDIANAEQIDRIIQKSNFADISYEKIEDNLILFNFSIEN